MEKSTKGIPVFEQYQRGIKETVNSVLKRVNREIAEREYVSQETYPFFRMRKELVDIIENSVGAPGVCDYNFQLQFPPDHVEGDFAVEAFGLAKKIGTNPRLLLK